MAEVAGIVQLYSVLNNKDASNDNVKQATTILATLYNDPNTLPRLFEVFGSCATDRGIQLQAMISITHMLGKEGACEFYKGNGALEAVKQQFLCILSETQDLVILPTICNAVSKVLKVECPWPEFLQLFSQFAGVQDKINVSKALLMLTEFLRHVESQHLAEMWTPFCQFAMQALSIEDTDVIGWAADVVGQLFTHADPEIEIFNTCLPELLGAVVGRLVQMMSMEDVTAYKLMTCCEYAAESDFEFNYGSIFQQLLGIVTNASLPIDHRSSLFQTISKFAEKAPDLDSFAGPLVEAAFMVAFQGFEPECSYDDQENMCEVMDIFEVLIRNADPSTIYELIKAKFGSNEPALHVAYVMALLVVIEKEPSLCVYDIKTHAPYALQLVGMVAFPIIQQTGFKLLAALMERKNPIFNDMIGDVMTAVTACLRIPNIPLITDVLTCLWFFLNAVNVSADLVDPILTSLLEVLSGYPLILQDKVVDCFLGLTLSAGEDIARVVPKLVPVLGEMLNLDNPEAALLKGSALQCMAVVIRFCQLDSPLVVSVLSACVQCLQSGDNVLIKSALTALKDLLKANRPEIGELVQPVLTVIHSILSTRPEFNNDDECDERNNITKTVWVAALRLVKWFVKKIPEAVAPVVGAVKQDIYTLMEQDTIQTEYGDDIMAEAFTAMTYLTIIYPADVGEVCRILITNGLDEDYPELATTCMRCFTTILEHIPVDETIISALTTCGFQSMRGEFECTDPDFVGELYQFFTTLAKRYTPAFPLNDYLEAAKYTVKNGTPFEVAEMISPLAFYFSIAHENIHPIAKKVMVDLFVSQLDICDMYVAPEPVAAVRTVIESEPDLVGKYMGKVFEFIDEKLGEEYDGEPCFDMTMDYIVSLLFSMFRMMKEAFPLDKYMAKMLELLPTTSSCPSEAENIYFSLCMLITEYPQVMGTFAGEIVRILAQLLSSKEYEWKDLDLRPEVATLCANIFVPTMAQGQTIIAQALKGDEQALARMTARVQELTATPPPQ